MIQVKGGAGSAQPVGRLDYGRATGILRYPGVEARDREKGGVLRLGTVVAATLAWALAALLLPAGAGAVTLPGGFQDSTAISGLESPDRASTSLRTAASSSPRRAASSRSSATSTTRRRPCSRTCAPRSTTSADRGIEGLVLDPSFPANPYVYVYYVHDAPIGGTAPVWGQPGQTYDDCPAPPAGPGRAEPGLRRERPRVAPARERRRADGPRAGARRGLVPAVPVARRRRDRVRRGRLPLRDRRRGRVVPVLGLRPGRRPEQQLASDQPLRRSARRASTASRRRRPPRAGACEARTSARRAIRPA